MDKQRDIMTEEAKMEIEATAAAEAETMPATEKTNLSDVLFIRRAVKQLCTHKKEAIVAAIALLMFAIATVLATAKVELLLEGAFEPAVYGHPVAPFAIASILAAVAVVGLVWALLSIAKPIQKRITALRLALLGFAFILMTAVKSLALGYFARILFAGDPTRFEFAKAGVDHASIVLALLFAAAFYVFLASCLKEEKISFAGFWKGFVTLLIWVSLVYLLKFAILFMAPEHIAISITIAIISTLAALWYVALALALQKEASENALLNDLKDDGDYPEEETEAEPDIKNDSDQYEEDVHE